MSQGCRTILSDDRWVAEVCQTTRATVIGTVRAILRRLFGDNPRLAAAADYSRRAAQRGNSMQIYKITW